MPKTQTFVGKKIQFRAARIFTGNPVKGLVISEDDEWIMVKLDHYIEGMVNGWHEGEEKDFRKTLISNIKILE